MGVIFWQTGVRWPVEHEKPADRRIRVGKTGETVFSIASRLTQTLLVLVHTSRNYCHTVREKETKIRSPRTRYVFFFPFDVTLYFATSRRKRVAVESGFCGHELVRKAGERGKTGRRKWKKDGAWTTHSWNEFSLLFRAVFWVVSCGFWLVSSSHKQCYAKFY